jgi:hypothetical protein
MAIKLQYSLMMLTVFLLYLLPSLPSFKWMYSK